MTKISSPISLIITTVFPIIWFGMAILGLIFSAGLIGSEGPSLGDSIVAILFLVAGYFLMKNTISKMADAVYVADQTLVFKKKGRETRIPFDVIENITHKKGRKSETVTVKTAMPTMFGQEILFLPKVSRDDPDNDHSIQKLIEQVNRAKK